MIRSLLVATLAALSLNVFAAVDANKASQAELESVKGIGPALSTKILDARKAASFKSWGDFVDRVAGVGPGNASRFSQAGLTVDGQTYVALAGEASAKPARHERKTAATAAAKTAPQGTQAPAK